MITLLKSTLKTFSIIFILMAIVSPMAKADNFENQQKQLFNKGTEKVWAMSDSVEKMLRVYIGSGGKIYWNDAKIKAPYKEYLGHFKDFNQIFERMWQLSQADFQKRNSQFKKIRSPKKCLSRAKKQKRQAVVAFNNTKKGYFRALSTRDNLAAQTTEIGNLVLQGETNITDGFVDGAIYDFGTDYMIAPPPGQEGERMDPSKMEPFINTIYNYGSDANRLFFSEFFKKFQTAIKTAKKSRSC